jgi:hypothetical protein
MPEFSQHILEIRTRALGGELDRQDDIGKEAEPGVQAPDVGKPLNGIARVGKDRAVEVVQGAGEDIREGSRTSEQLYAWRWASAMPVSP